MSECVVRMEMPSNCWVCPFGSDRFIWDENNGRPHYVMVRFCSRHSGEEFHVLEADTIDRPWFCDSFICQLPEGHGRLGDLDKLEGVVNMARIRVMRNGEDTNPYWECADLILQAPTIVPADTEERSET